MTKPLKLAPDTKIPEKSASLSQKVIGMTREEGGAGVVGLDFP